MRDTVDKEAVDNMLRAIIMGDTTITADIMEGITDTITGDMHRTEQPSGSFSVGPLLEAFTVHSGGLITLCPYLQPITTPTMNSPILPPGT